MHPFDINRRSFLKGATATLALTALGAHGLSFASPAKALKVGLIGAGWYGKSDLFRLMQVTDVDVVALCDVDKNMLAEAASLVSQRQKSRKKPRLYEDYRKMLTDNKFDIVLIGTPDHWHALPTIAAIKAGAHVYVQKPISMDVMEGEAMLAAARKYNRVVQVGTQRRSTPHLIEAKKNIIDAGLLGKVAHVEMYCYYHMRSKTSPEVRPVPDFLNYDLWTGPAPLRPYDGPPHRRWRNFMEYSNGIVGDMCIHMFDAARWMLDLGWPKRISSTGGIYVQEEGKANISDTQTATFEYDELNCIWQHRTWGTPVNPEYPWGLTIYGEKGTLLASPHQYDFIPVDEKSERIHRDAVYEKEKYPEDLKEEGIELHAAPATRLHMQDFLAAIHKGSKPVADIEQGHISTASCILANISMLLGRPLVYDPIKHEIPGDPEATLLLQRPYRQPWVHPDLNKV